MEKYKVTINNKVYEVEVEKVGDDYTLPQETPDAVSSDNGTGASMKAPIQGTVLKILVHPGDSIKKGEPVLIIEAMKLENEIVADRDGVIDRILVSTKQVVDNGQALIQYRG